MKLRTLLNVCFVLVLLVTGWLAFECRNIRFDYDFEHFFPVDSDDTDFYYAFRQRFGAENDFIIIGIPHERSVFEPVFLRRLDSLSQALKDIPQVRSVTGLTTVKIPVIHSFGITELPLVNPDEPGRLAEDSARILASGLYRGILVSADALHTAIVVRHSEQLAKPSADSLLEAVTREVETRFGRAYISGKIKWEKAYLGKTQRELILFMFCSVLLVSLFLWFTFRNIWGVVIPLVVVLTAIVWTIGLMVMAGKPIDLMVILLPCILFVVGMSDVIHITSQFYEKTNEGLPKEQAIRTTLKEVGFATFLTCIATAVAFLSLNTTAIRPIRDFGTYTAAGVVAAYILSVTILPWVLLRVKNPDRFRIHAVQLKWDRFLRDVLRRVYRHPGRIIAGTCVVLAVSAWGMGMIRFNNSVLDDLGEDDPIKVDLRFFDRYFSGLRGFELAVSTGDSSRSILEWEHVRELERVSAYMRDSLQMSGIGSPVELIRVFRQAIHDDDPAYFGLPSTEQEFDTLRQRIRPFLNQKQARMFLSADAREARISARLRDKGSLQVGAKNEKLKSFLSQNTSGSLKYRITGSSDLIDKSNGYLTANMLEGLSLDIIVLMLIISIIFRSWRMMLISVLPNIIPLFAISGLMGWAGIEMKVTISIIFSIAFGIVVDDTLHLLSRLKIELDKGVKLPQALRTTYLSTGKAMILTALVIAVGFSTLMLSDFKSTFYVGMMISITLLIALVAELLLMPVLILVLYGKHYRKKLINKRLKTT